MDKQKRIIETATKLFLNNGYSKTTMREIAEGAKVNLGLLPYYFGKKEYIAKIIYDNIMEEISDQEIIQQIKCENSLEKFLLMYNIIHNEMFKRKGFFNYYLELIINDIVATEPQPYSYQIIKTIILEQNLDIDNDTLNQYFIILKGAERALIIKKEKKEINISYIKINELLVRGILLMLGINNDTIDKSIKHANEILTQMNIHSKLYE